MKKFLFVLSAGLMTSAYADMITLHCDSLLGTDHNISLIVVNQSLKQVRIPNFMDNGYKALNPHKLPNQCFEGKTLYAFSGTKAIMEIENVVLEGKEGVIRIDDEEFNCH